MGTEMFVILLNLGVTRFVTQALNTLNCSLNITSATLCEF